MCQKSLKKIGSPNHGRKRVGPTSRVSRSEPQRARPFFPGGLAAFQVIFFHPTQVYRDYNKPLPSLKLTTNAPENWWDWKMVHFLLGARLPGRCELLVSRRVFLLINQDSMECHWWVFFVAQVVIGSPPFSLFLKAM